MVDRVEPLEGFCSQCGAGIRDWVFIGLYVECELMQGVRDDYGIGS